MPLPATDALLPDVLRRAAGSGTPLGALCAAMDAMLSPAEVALDDVDAWFDPYRAPDAVVPHLARWVGLGHLLSVGPDASPAFPAGMGRLRVLVAEAAALAQTRGTLAGLVRTLTLATGVDGFVVDERPVDPEGRRRPFHLVVHLPSGSTVDVNLVARIVEADRPGHLTYEIAEPAPIRALPPPVPTP